MGWSSIEENNTKEGMATSSKILLAIIACLALIMVVIIILLLNIETNTFNLTIDTKVKEDYDISKLITKIDDCTYVNIEEFAQLVGYEYHKGEYKAFTIEEKKCYVQGKDETASFFLDDNRVCKLPVNKLDSDYSEFTVQNTIKDIEGKMYAPIDAIKLAFNVVISEKETSFDIYTLSYLVTLYNNNVIKWGYTGIIDQNFENQKSLLYGYLIVKKENGLYKIIDNENKKEIVSDKYNSIQFNENTKEFFVTNSLSQVGIIKLDGTTKIEPIYNSISVLDKKSDLYLVKKNEKYGVVKSGNVTVVYPEYDSIGLGVNRITNDMESQYLILDTLIPVCKNNKWGAFDKSGNMIYKLEYNGFGCHITAVDIGGTKKEVKPVVCIEECDGVVVRQGDKYGLLNIKGDVLVPVAVDSIYSIEILEEKEYFMKYNNEELNVIERLIKAGLIEDTSNKNNISQITNSTTNTVNTNLVNSVATNQISNNVVQ